jgi:hypothetical protein
MLVLPFGAMPGSRPISWAFEPLVTGPSSSSTGDEASLENETRPARLPMPVRSMLTKSSAACRASSILTLPSPALSLMLPERSKTSITARSVGGSGTRIGSSTMVAIAE